MSLDRLSLPAEFKGWVILGCPMPERNPAYDNHILAHKTREAMADLYAREHDLTTFWTVSINGGEYEDLECKSMSEAEDWARDLCFDRHRKDEYRPTKEYFRFFWDEETGERVICESQEA